MPKTGTFIREDAVEADVLTFNCSCISENPVAEHKTNLII